MDGDATFEVTTTGKIITSGTTRNIIDSFVRQTQDVDQILYLLEGYEQFTSSLVFLKEVIDCFKSNASDQLKLLRIVNILKKWFEASGRELRDKNSEVGKEVFSFMEYIQQNHPQLTNFIRSPFESGKEKQEREEAIPLVPPPIISLKRIKKKKGCETILCYDSEEVARQLTLLDHQYFVKINRKEMIRTRWIRPQDSPTLHEYSVRSNKISYWLAYQLVEDRKLKTRIKRLDHFIKIAMYLSKIHNYQSLMAVFLAVNMVSAKLSQTWKALKPKTVTTWKRISSLMSPIDNFTHYRESIKNLETPYIPCQEVILKDLLYHDESIPDFIEEGVWNYKKLQVIGKMLDQFRRCQDSQFNFLPLKELQDLIEDIPEMKSSQLDSVPTDLEINTTTLKMSRLIPTARGEFKEVTTESDTTEDADSSLGNTTIIASNTLVRASRTRSGSLGSDYELKRKNSFDNPSPNRPKKDIRKGHQAEDTPSSQTTSSKEEEIEPIDKMVPTKRKQ